MPFSQVCVLFNRKVRVTIVTWLLLLTAAPLCAQQPSAAGDLSLEDLLNVKVYSASKHEQTTAEAPSSITVVTRADIDKYGYRTLTDIFRSVTGFYVRNHGNYSTLGVRGFAPPNESNGRILLLVNGHAVNDNINDSAPIGDDFPIDIDLIDRIEIVRGPSSSLYGADAFFAVVNVITRTGSTAKGATASSEVSSFSTFKETVTYGVDHQGTQALLSTTYNTTAAPGRLGSTEDPIGSSGDRDQSRRLFAMVSSHGFTLQTAVSSLQEKAPTSAQWCGSCHQTDTHALNFRGYADIQYDHALGHGLQVSARGYYDTTAYHGSYEQLHSCNEARCHGSAMDYDIAHGDWAGGELKITKRFHDKDRITVGTEYRDNFRQSQLNYLTYQNPANPTPSSMGFVNYNRSSHLWGIYGEGEFQLARQLILNVGVRTDQYNMFGSTTNPRAALIYSPRKTTTLKLLAGSAFRAPSFSELYFAGMDSQAAPNLKPETIRSYEAVWEQQIAKRITLDASGFYNRIGKYIDEDTVVVKGVSQTVLTNSAGDAKGLEFELRGKLAGDLQGRVSYSLQDARNSLTGASLLDAPRHIGQVNLDAPLFRHWLNAGIEAQYMSRCLSENSLSGYASTPAVVNATVSTRPLPWGFTLSASAYNLVGRSLSDPLAPYAQQDHTVPATSLLPDDRRSFRFKLTWTSHSESKKADLGTPPAPASNQQSQEGH